jgi:hypothetical protein
MMGYSILIKKTKNVDPLKILKKNKVLTGVEFNKKKEWLNKKGWKMIETDKICRFSI